MSVYLPHKKNLPLPLKITPPPPPLLFTINYFIYFVGFLLVLSWFAIHTHIHDKRAVGGGGSKWLKKGVKNGQLSYVFRC